MLYIEEGEDDAKSAWPSDALGNTGATMAENNGLPNRKVEPIPSNSAPVQIEVCNSTS